MAKQQAVRAPQDGITALEAAQPKVELGSPEHAALLATGYGMSIDDARRIIKEREANPQLWPFEEYQKARAMLEAFEAPKPEPSSTRQPWRVRGHARVVRSG